MSIHRRNNYADHTFNQQQIVEHYGLRTSLSIPPAPEANTKPIQTPELMRAETERLRVLSQRQEAEVKPKLPRFVDPRCPEDFSFLRNR